MGLELEQVQGVMQIYCCALVGAPIKVLDTRALVRQNLGWVNENAAATDGRAIFLPVLVECGAQQQDDFAWLKVLSTHQVAHLEFGSFTFAFDTPAAVFTERHAQRESTRRGGLPEQEDQDGLRSLLAYTAMGRFFHLFANRYLAFDLFTVLEDCRLDYRIAVEYPGIGSALRRAQAEALASRPQITVLPMQEALVELLIRMSLEQLADLCVPKLYKDAAVGLACIVHQLRTTQASVQDTAEATLRAYAIISRIPNVARAQEQWQCENLEKPGAYSEAAYEACIAALQARRNACGQSGVGRAYRASVPVVYRGEFKPDIVQLLTQLRMHQDWSGEGQCLSQEMLERLLQEDVELLWETAQDGLDMSLSLFAQSLMQTDGVGAPNATLAQGSVPQQSDDEQDGTLQAQESRTYVYDEWDFGTAAYRPRWCIVRESVLAEGDTTFYHETLRDYNALLARIKHQFERFAPENVRKVYRLLDGEDVDLNAALEAWADLRLHLPPNDKIYWRRHHVQRDVAMVFLLDMSASTAESINTDPQLVDDRSKRIIDVAKESTVLLLQALEAIGDAYAIYGFSGHGRDNVEFYIIKDLAERFGERIKRRLDTIVPRHATRMGAAIRHATAKLEQQEAATKVLFLLSDGRPQDREYSQPGAEKEYAVHDTHRALVEAQRKGVTPFCLTVDKAGNDYMQAMCGTMGYEVLENIRSLPTRLPMLYRALTR